MFVFSAEPDQLQFQPVPVTAAPVIQSTEPVLADHPYTA